MPDSAGPHSTLNLRIVNQEFLTFLFRSEPAIADFSNFGRVYILTPNTQTSTANFVFNSVAWLRRQSGQSGRRVLRRPPMAATGNLLNCFSIRFDARSEGLCLLSTTASIQDMQDRIDRELPQRFAWRGCLYTGLLSSALLVSPVI